MSDCLDPDQVHISVKLDLDQDHWSVSVSNCLDLDQDHWSVSVSNCLDPDQAVYKIYIKRQSHEDDVLCTVFENYKNVIKLNSTHMIITYINLHIKLI